MVIRLRPCTTRVHPPPTPPHPLFPSAHGASSLRFTCHVALTDSGFLDESGSAAAWYLQGKLSSDATRVDLEAAEWQQQQQQQQTLRSGTNLRTETGTGTSGGEGGGSLRNEKPVAAASADDGSDSVGKFLQRLADASGTPSSILGGLPEDDPTSTAESTGAGTARTATQDTNPQLDASGEEERGAGGGDREGEKPAQAPHLVLFARAKGRPFVYCGAVDCVAEEYVGSARSSRLGAVRFTLALREWREAAMNSGGKGEAGDRVASGGRSGNEAADVFTEVVREGLRPPALVRGLPSEDRVVG